MDPTGARCRCFSRASLRRRLIRKSLDGPAIEAVYGPEVDGSDMRVRTVYFKVRELEPVRNWWRAFLGCEPSKVFAAWCEFRVGDTNLGLLSLATHVPGPGRSSCIPVFEFPDDEIVAVIARAKGLGATALLEGEAHPDYPNVAAVLVDPFGSEFEVTTYHGRGVERCVPSNRPLERTGLSSGGFRDRWCVGRSAPSRSASRAGLAMIES